jgi:hypothetical protein
LRLSASWGYALSIYITSKVYWKTEGLFEKFLFRKKKGLGNLKN